MSLKDFQRALCDLIACPDLCILLRTRPEEVLGRYELSLRERRRLIVVVWQRGMSVNCTLYRVNRITPVYTLLPLTCFLLGDDLLREMERFWSTFAETDLQFKPEVERFAAFLRRRVQLGEVDDPYLIEVLDFELAANELRFLPRRRILRELEWAPAGGRPGGLRLNPLVRVLRFRHDPLAMLRMLAERRTPPPNLAEGEFFLVLDGRGDDLGLSVIGPRLGRLLRGIQDEGSRLLSSSAAGLLIRAGLLVRSGERRETAPPSPLPWSGLEGGSPGGPRERASSRFKLEVRAGGQLDYFPVQK